MVLKALSDHHLSRDTPLESALQRAQAVYKILQKVHGGRINVAALKEHLITCDSMVDQVKNIKEELIKESQWRPVFADMFRQGIKSRRRAGFLRHLLVESGITYANVCEIYKVIMSNNWLLLVHHLMSMYDACFRTRKTMAWSNWSRTRSRARTKLTWKS